MVTIAAITMVFLPGTFVAVSETEQIRNLTNNQQPCFSISLFNWNGNGKTIVEIQFWIYWVVTVPLTIFIVVSCYLWFNYNPIRILETARGATNLDRRMVRDLAELCRSEGVRS